MLDRERADELFAAFGPVRCLRMFSGVGIYAGDVMFALEVRDALYLKSDETTAAAFDAEDGEALSYVAARGRRMITSYRRVPERLLNEPDEFAAWTKRSLSIAEAKTRAAPKKRRARKTADAR